MEMASCRSPQNAIEPVNSQRGFGVESGRRKSSTRRRNLENTKSMHEERSSAVRKCLRLHHAVTSAVDIPSIIPSTSQILQTISNIEDMTGARHLVRILLMHQPGPSRRISGGLILCSDSFRSVHSPGHSICQPVIITDFYIGTCSSLRARLQCGVPCARVAAERQ